MLSPRSLDLLTDLVENRIAAMQIRDRDDMKEMALLNLCRGELKRLSGAPVEPAAVGGRRGRQRRSVATFEIA